MRTLSLPLFLCVVAGALCAQTTEQVLLETPQVRVVQVTEASHKPGRPHEHWSNRVLFYRDSGHMTLNEPDGRVQDIEFTAGDVRWSRAGSPYIAENLTENPIRIIEVELKGKGPGAPAPVTKLDPVAVDARHYKTEFENEQVRIMRIHFGPHEKSVVHEHILNRVVIYLNDQGAQKAGDVRVAGAATHTEENAGDQAADRIAIELK
jgi:quercetin dioxygenase-like cupin family protein